MKRLAVSLLAMAILAISSVAQGQIGPYELSKITVAHGRTPLSSGLDLTVKFTAHSRTLALQANADRLNGVHEWDRGLVAVAITGGLFSNTPYLGARAAVDWTPRFSTMHWFGAFSGAPGVTEWDPQFFFSYHGLTLDLGALELGDALIHYRHDRPRQTPWMTYTIGLNHHFSLAPTVTWEIRKEEVLYQLAVTWKPPAK